MNLSLEKIINAKLAAVFNELNLNPQFAAVKVSDRPDLSDFQCNGALALAKAEKKNPREIASAIAAKLEQDADFAKVSVDGPGFLNLKVNDALIAKVLDGMAADERFGCEKCQSRVKSCSIPAARMWQRRCTSDTCVQRPSARLSAGLKFLPETKLSQTFTLVTGERRWE